MTYELRNRMVPYTPYKRRAYHRTAPPGAPTKSKKARHDNEGINEVQRCLLEDFDATAVAAPGAPSKPKVPPRHKSMDSEAKRSLARDLEKAATPFDHIMPPVFEEEWDKMCMDQFHCQWVIQNEDI